MKPRRSAVTVVAALAAICVEVALTRSCSQVVGVMDDTSFAAGPVLAPHQF